MSSYILQTVSIIEAPWKGRNLFIKMFCDTMSQCQSRIFVVTNNVNVTCVLHFMQLILCFLSNLVVTLESHGDCFLNKTHYPASRLDKYKVKLSLKCAQIRFSFLMKVDTVCLLVLHPSFVKLALNLLNLSFHTTTNW